MPDDSAGLCRVYATVPPIYCKPCESVRSNILSRSALAKPWMVAYDLP